MIRQLARKLLAIAAFIFLFGSSTGAFAQVPSRLDSLMDYVVSQDEGSWWWYRYQRSSMNSSRIIDSGGYYDTNGRFHYSVVLIKGYFHYKSDTTFFGSDGYVLVRFNSGRVTCVSYDTSWTSDCTKDTDAVSYWWRALQDWFWSNLFSWALAF